MKRAGGKVTWMLEFDGRFETAVRDGLKRQTVRRCHIVEPGDTLRLAGADTGRVFGEVTVARVRRIVILAVKLALRPDRLTAFQARIDGKELSEQEFDAFAGNDGFASADEMVKWLEDHGKFKRGIFDGQVIEW